MATMYTYQVNGEDAKDKYQSVYVRAISFEEALDKVRSARPEIEISGVSKEGEFLL